MWQLKYDAPVGSRVNRGFMWVNAQDMWFHEKIGQWLPDIDMEYGPVSSGHWGPKTTKAFLRYLRKHPELQTCGEVTLVHREYIADGEGGVLHSLDIRARWVDTP